MLQVIRQADAAISAGIYVISVDTAKLQEPFCAASSLTVRTEAGLRGMHSESSINQIGS